jgi:hypothetical protein
VLRTKSGAAAPTTGLAPVSAGVPCRPQEKTTNRITKKITAETEKAFRVLFMVIPFF